MPLLSVSRSPSLFSVLERPALTFAVRSQTACAVVEICLRLDGLPLAIELAAARTTLLAPGELLNRLSSRLSLLTSGARDAPGRHQTLKRRYRLELRSARAE